jgi:hypothetical protein
MRHRSTCKSLFAATFTPKSIENFWALLKCGLKGTYVAVEPYHLDCYVTEQVFRDKNRKMTDGERFDLAAKGMVGKRLTYAEVTGKVQGQDTF